MKKVILFCCFYLVIISILGCEGPAGPEGHSGQMKYSVLSEVVFTSDTLPTNAYIIVSNISSIPSVKINQNDIKFRDLYSEGSYYWDTLHNITAGDDVQLNISGNQGEADATVRIPEQFSIQSPDPDSIFLLPPHGDFIASWPVSNFADYYHAYFYLNYTYIPIGEETSEYFHIEIDTIFSTTSFTIPATRLFPPDFDSLSSSWSYGDFRIEAINGPRPEVGAQGNITGDGIGFLFGRSNGGNIEIKVQNSAMLDSGTKLKYDFKREQSERFYKKFLK